MGVECSEEIFMGKIGRRQCVVVIIYISSLEN